MQITAAFILLAAAAAPAFAASGDASAAHAAIISDPSAISYCGKLLKSQCHTTTIWTTKTKTITVPSIVTMTVEHTGTTTVTPTNTLTIGAKTSVFHKTATVTSTSTATGTVNVAKRAEPTSFHVIARAALPASLSGFASSAVEAACQAVVRNYIVTEYDVSTKTVTVHKGTATATKNVAVTVTKTAAAKTKTTHVGLLKETVTTTHTSVVPKATVAAYAFGLRDLNGGAVDGHLSLSDGFLTFGSGSPIHGAFVATMAAKRSIAARSNLQMGYFVSTDDSSLCLSTDPYNNGAIAFTPCGTSPQIFYLDTIGGFNFIYPTTTPVGIAVSGDIVVFSANSTVGFSWARGNTH